MFKETIEDLVEKKIVIDKFKREHPELSEIIETIEDYYQLLEKASKQIQPYIPYPYGLTIRT